jgi:hypothetical protein
LPLWIFLMVARHQGLVHGFHARAVRELLEEDLVDARIAQQRDDIGPARLVHVEEIGDGQEQLNACSMSRGCC